MEDLAYRRLLDLYYLNEQPLTGCVDDVAREIGLTENKQSVEYVLTKFFTLDENVFRQKRIDLEIKKYKSNAKNKSNAGKASAKARQAKASGDVTGVEQVLNTKATGEQLTNNQEPLTINQEPLTKLKDKDSTPAIAVDYSTLQMTDDELKELKRIRKKCKGGALTQRVINGLAKEFNTASAMSYSYDEILTEWETRGWKSFKAEWLKPKQSGGISAITQKNIQNLEGEW
jgi:uncharacterized protein YdaU (DUF1376 family)